MKGISFGQYHSYDDFGLILNKKVISAPSPKTHYVDIEGADGSLDFSEAFGEVKFERRDLEFEFTSLAPRSEFWDKFTEIQNALHGREFHISDDEDPDYYYIGRVTIDKWSIDRVIGSFKVKVSAEPYKYHLRETQRTDTITGTKTMVYRNDRMSVIPIFRASAPMTLVFGEISTSISAGADYYYPEIVFREGNNTLEVTGEGTLTVRYQEGAL